jgi:hypothetical protein
VIHFRFPRPNQDLSGCPAPGFIVARLALLAKHRDRIMLPAKDPKKIIRGASPRSRSKFSDFSAPARFGISVRDVVAGDVILRALARREASRLSLDLLSNRAKAS